MKNDTERPHVRVVFVVQQDLFYARLFFEELLVRFDAACIAGVVLCPVFARQSKASAARALYRFFGLSGLMRLGWRCLEARFGDPTLEEFLAGRGIPVWKCNDIAGDEFVRYVAGKRPEVVIGVSMPDVFDERVAKLPKFGCLNIHHAVLLGRWDVTSNFWQLYYNSRNTGVTVYRINSRKEGEILVQDEVPIWLDESLDNLLKRTRRLGGACIVKVLELIKNNALSPLVRFPGTVPALEFPGKDAVLEFRRRGKRLF
ncbi:MAG: formyltransferase family protein [Endomicrobiales bacterium]